MVAVETFIDLLPVLFPSTTPGIVENFTGVMIPSREPDYGLKFLGSWEVSPYPFSIRKSFLVMIFLRFSQRKTVCLLGGCEDTHVVVNYNGKGKREQEWL